MATNSRPTTEFHVTYGALSTVAAERSLNPVIIAPRYKIHSYEKGYADASIGEYDAVRGIKDINWPSRTAGSVIDIASSEVYAQRPIVALNETPIVGSRSSVRSNEIIIENASLVQTELDGKADTENRPVDAYGLHRNLRGFSVQVGDKVKFEQENGSEGYATITSIGKSYLNDAVVKTPVAVEENKGTYAGPVVDESAVYTGVYNASYLVKFLTESDNGVAAVRITDVSGGDDFYTTTLHIGSTPTEIGRKGVKISFPGDLKQCAENDAWVIECKPASGVIYNVIRVNAVIESDITPVNLTFCTNRYSSDYVRVQNKVTMTNAGIDVAEGASVNVGEYSCAIVEAPLFAVYRERLVSDALQIVSSSAAGAAMWAGTADRRNPMGLMYAACTGVGSNAFFYMITPPSDDEEGYIQAINYAAQFEEMYAFVTWVDTPAVYAAKQAAVAKYSSPTVAQFKKNWYAPEIKQEEVIYSASSNGAALLARIDAKGKAIIEAPGDAIYGGVAPGDYMVFYSDVNPSTGEWSGTRYKVMEIEDGNAVILENPVLTPACRVEFVRVLSNADFAQRVANEAAKINDHRVNLVWCAGQVNFGGFTNLPPSIVAGILATTRASLAPHAPMTGMSVSGITLTDTYKFTDAEYEVMNAGGVWIVANNTQGVAVNYHQITTKTDGSVAEEDSCVSAGDAVVREIRRAVSVLTAGTVNVTEALVNDVRTQIGATMSMIMGRSYPASYGPLIEDYKIIALGRPADNNAALMLKMDIDTPQPLLKGQVYVNII